MAEGEGAKGPARAATAARAGAGALRSEASCSLFHCFGVRGGIRENALYVSDTSIIYPVGAHVAVTHLDKRDQQFLDLARGVQRVDAMQTSPLQGSSVPASKYVALCEQAQPAAGGPVHAQATVYSLAQRKKLQTVAMQTPHTFTACAFSGDAKLLATLTAEPDNQIAMWKWGGEKLIAHERMRTAATRVRFHPQNNAMMSTSGPSHLRVWRLGADFALKPQQMVLTRLEQQNWVDHIWLGGDYVVAVTDAGSIVVLKQSENAEASQPSHSPAGAGALAMVGAVSSSTNHGALMLVQQLKCDLPEGVSVECLACHGKGFVAGGEQGCMAIFERQEDPKEPFSRAKVFAPSEEGATEAAVTSLTPSPNSESLLAVMRSGGSYALRAFPLAQYDALGAEGDHFAPVMGHVADPGPVGSLTDQAGCVLRPITVTIGSDAVARVWNFLTHRCEVSAQLADEPTCASLHPAGFILLLGFKDRVRILNVQYRGLPVFRELPFKHCRVLAFSHGGHLFAAAFGIAISVFDTHSLQQRHSFTGHIGTVAGLVWSEDDSTLVSLGDDGAVYGWWIADGTRIGGLSHVVKGVSHLDGVLERSTNTLVVASADHTLREIVDGSITENVYPTGDATVTQLLLTPQGTARFLLAGTSDGCVRVYSWPLTSPDYREIRVHSSPVRRLCLSPDLKVVSSAGEDGTLFLLALHRVERGVQVVWEPPQRASYNADPLLLGSEEVQETADQVEDLAKQMEAERSDREYQLHMEQQRWQEEIRRRAEEGEAALEAERARHKKLSREYEEFYKKSMEKQKETERRHAEDRQALINAHEHKWALEMERFDRLSEDMEALRQRCAKELEEQATAHQRAMDAEAEAARREKEALQKKVRQLDEDLQFNREKYAEVLQQQEDEYEMELKFTKEKADTEVQQERSGTAVIERELNTLKNENNQLQKQLDEAHSQQKQLEDARLRMEERAAKLDKARDHLNQHLEERERSLKDKDRALLQLRSENRTLRNFRFVLDNRIKTMMHERGPITDHIDRLEEHVRNMYGELVQEFGEKKTTDAEMRRMVLKADGLSAEVDKLRNLVREKDQTVASIRHDLSQTVQFKDPRDVEDGVKRMFRLYVKGDKQTKAVIPRGGNRAQQETPPRRSSPGRGQREEGGREDEGEGGEEDEEVGAGGGAAARSSGQASDRNTAHELVRQRDYMERTVAVLRRSLKQAEQRLTQQSRQTVTENGTLISECNRLRRETKLQQQRIQQLTERVRMLVRGSAALPRVPCASHSLQQRQQGFEASEEGAASPQRVARAGAVSRGSSLPPRSGTGAGATAETPGAKGSSQAAGTGMRAARAAKGGSSRSAVVKLSSRVPSPIRSASPSSSVRGSVVGARSRGRLQTSQSGAPPRLVAGSSSNLRRVNTARSRIYSMVEQLDGNDQRIEEQEAEIRQLKEQLHELHHLTRSGVSLPSGGGRQGADALPPLQSASTAPAQVQLDSAGSGGFGGEEGVDAGPQSAGDGAAPQSFSPASTAQEHNVMGWGSPARGREGEDVAPTHVPTATAEQY